MDQLHVHLFINHLPVAGTILGTIVLILALLFRSKHTTLAAYTLFIISSAGAGIAYLTGEGAEEAVEHIPGIIKDSIERHEDFSLYALIAMIILGIASLAGAFLVQKKSRLVKRMSYFILALSVISFSLIAWTAYLGGQIRHTELKRDSQTRNEQIYRDESYRKLP